MPRKLTAMEVAESFGYDDPVEYAQELIETGDTAPACCSEDCMVEHDGKCPHGFPSLILELNLI